MAELPAISSRILGEAADWMVRLRDGALSPQEQRRLQQWRERSVQHAEAWQRAQRVFDQFEQVPDPLARRILPELAANASRSLQHRRRLLAALGLVTVAAPAVWVTQRHLPGHLMLASDYRSGMGEVREVRLPDGSLLVLNSNSAVDIHFNEHERRVRLLAGEVLIETSHLPDPGQRPFLVQTTQGTAQALGTLYSVRQYDQETGVAVFAGRVAIQRSNEAGTLAVLQPGQSLRFGDDGPGHSAPVDDSALMWRQGMLVARDMPLAELLGELGRYRTGILRSSPKAGQLRVSGAFPLRDTDTSIALLADTLPIRVSRRTSYWVTITHRAE